jgi:hypothetical protein
MTNLIQKLHGPLSEDNMTYYKNTEMTELDRDILNEAKKLGFRTKDLGDTYIGSQRQLTDLVKMFIIRYADDGK